MLIVYYLKKVYLIDQQVGLSGLELLLSYCSLVGARTVSSL